MAKGFKMQTPHEIFEAVYNLPPTEREVLIETLHAADGRVDAAASKSSADDIENALASIPGCSANLRHAIVAALVKKGVINAHADKISAASSRKTLNSIAAASSTSVPLLQNIQRTARRMGFDIVPDKPVDPVALDKAIAGADVVQRIALKMAMSQVGLIP
jgi:hypothetical protein